MLCCSLALEGGGPPPRRVGAAPEVDRILVTLGQDLSVSLRTQRLEQFVGRKVQNLILSLLLVRRFFGWCERPASTTNSLFRPVGQPVGLQDPGPSLTLKGRYPFTTSPLDEEELGGKCVEIGGYSHIPWRDEMVGSGCVGYLSTGSVYISMHLLVSQ